MHYCQLHELAKDANSTAMCGIAVLTNARGQQAFAWLICGGSALVFLDAGNQAECTQGQTQNQHQSQPQCPQPAESEV